MGMSSSVTLAGSSVGSGAADVVGQPNGAGEVGLETPKAWSVMLACSRRVRDLPMMLIFLRQIGDNVEELHDCVGLDVRHQNSHKNSEGLAVSCAQGGVRAGDPQLSS
jgi:hypothetical protein